MLFQELDVNKDGMIDEFEFEMLFSRIPTGATQQQDGPMGQESGAGEENYMQGGYNTYNKKPLDVSEMLQLPKFTGQVRAKMEMRRRGKEVG